MAKAAKEKANPISMSNIDINDPKTQALGMQMLKSGQVSPEEVQAAQTAASDPEGAKDWLTAHLDQFKQAAPGLASFGTPSAMSASSLPSAAGLKTGKMAQSKQQTSQKTDTKMSQSRDLFAAPDDYAQRASLVESQPYMQDQKKGISDLENALSMQQAQNAPPDSDYWVRPLLSLTDSTTGSKLLSGYQKPESRADRNQKLLKSQEDLQAKKGDYSKQVMEGIKSLKEGKQTDSQNNQVSQALAYLQGQAGNGSGYGEARRNAMIAKSGQAFDNDKLLKDAHNTYNSLNRAESMMNGKTPITGKNFAVLQQDMINAFAPGGAATEGKVNREMVETLAAKINDIQQQFGSIKDLRKEQPAVFAQLQGLISQVKTDYSRAAQKRAGEIHSSFRDVPDDAVQSTINRKLNDYKDTFGGDLPEESPTMDFSKKKKTPSAKPKTVVQGGHTYTLNEATGEYE